MNDQFSILWGSRRINHRQIDLYTASAIKQLKGLGIKAGDRIAIWDENSVEYVVLLLALWQLKAVAAPIHFKWPQKMVQAYVSKINARKIFTNEDIKRIVCFDARHEVHPTRYDFDTEQEVVIVATSGSSGDPKPAVLTWGNLYFNALGSQSVMPLSIMDGWLLSLPLSHVSGLGILTRCLSFGSAVVIQDGDLISTIKRGKVTHVSLVATQLYRLLADPLSHDFLKQLKCILLGGSAIPSSLLEQALNLGLNVFISYGLTETASQVASGKVTRGNFACAMVLPYRQVKIEQEEILVKGDVLFKGYIQGGKIVRPLTEDGWFKTGDRGEKSDQNVLTVLGRVDNMFISGGENIQPEEIEKAILAINGICEVVVVPKESLEYGFRPVAFVRFTGSPIPEAKIKEMLSKDLPGIKIPTQIYSWPQDLLSRGLKLSRKDFISRI